MAPAVECGAYRHVAIAVKSNLDCHDAHAAFQSNGFGDEVAAKVSEHVRAAIEYVLESRGFGAQQDKSIPAIRIGKWISITGMKSRDAIRVLILIIATLLLGVSGLVLVRTGRLGDRLENMQPIIEGIVVQ